MRNEYDFTKLKGRNNPFAKQLKKQITIRINRSAIDYFKRLSEEAGVPYQNLIDSYLTECAENKKKPFTRWV